MPSTPSGQSSAAPSSLDLQRKRLSPLLLDFGEKLARLIDQVPPVAPGSLHLTPRDCTRLEEVTGLGSTRAPEDLFKAVERLASVRIGDIRIPFTPGQLLELQHRATKRGRTIEQEMRAVVARLEDELFYKGG